jgi:hypothetical protein
MVDAEGRTCCRAREDQRPERIGLGFGERGGLVIAADDIEDRLQRVVGVAGDDGVARDRQVADAPRVGDIAEVDQAGERAADGEGVDLRDVAVDELARQTGAIGLGQGREGAAEHLGLLVAQRRGLGEHPRHDPGGQPWIPLAVGCRGRRCERGHRGAHAGAQLAEPAQPLGAEVRHVAQRDAGDPAQEPNAVLAMTQDLVAGGGGDGERQAVGESRAGEAVQNGVLELQRHRPLRPVDLEDVPRLAVVAGDGEVLILVAAQRGQPPSQPPVALQQLGGLGLWDQWRHGANPVRSRRR